MKALTPEQARAEYEASKKGRSIASDPGGESVHRGARPARAWVTDIRIPNYTDPITGERRQIKGISTAAFVANMRKLIAAAVEKGK